MLLIAQAPPDELDRYFYFPDLTSDDWLFRGVVKALTAGSRLGRQKRPYLAELFRRGVFLIDVSREPVRSERPNLAPYVPALVKRVRTLQPRRVILIKVDVYDHAFADLTTVGIPVVDERIPVPSTGQQKGFRTAFARALAKSEASRAHPKRRPMPVALPRAQSARLGEGVHPAER